MFKFKVNDVIEVRLEIEVLNLPDDIKEYDITDYETNIKTTYTYNDGNSFVDTDMSLEAGLSPAVGYEIEDWIKEDLKSLFEEIDDYDIFEVNKEDSNEQRAKIRVKSIKE